MRTTETDKRGIRMRCAECGHTASDQCLGCSVPLCEDCDSEHRCQPGYDYDAQRKLEFKERG